MKNPHLDFYENHLPKHVSRALGDRLKKRQQKPSQLEPTGDETHVGTDIAESDDGEAQSASNIPGASLEDDGQSPVPRRVFMIPSEKEEKAIHAKKPPPGRSPMLKPKVLGR